jgi:hypothetical protein
MSIENCRVPASAWAAGAFLIGLFASALPARAQSTASVTVSAGTPWVSIPPTAFGLNTAIWDGNLMDAAVPGLISSAGITALRYPGGSTSDLYNWQTNAIVPGQGSYANPNNGFDAFMGLAKRALATPIITVNYGSNQAGNGGGTPAFAAQWVQYANITQGYGIKYWEVGNEIYGNGEYGSQWEADLHSAHDPATYGANVAAFASAMKAVDPTIKIGAVLTAPGNWPDGQAPDWNSNVLARCGSTIDFVIVHWYPVTPGQETDAALLAAPQSGFGGSPGIAAMMTRLKALIAQYGGANAANIQVLVTETNSVPYNPGKQSVSLVNGMFVADAMLTWVENGAASVDLWDLHNGSAINNNSASLYGSANYGDYGILSNGSANEPAPDTPQPTYYGVQMLTRLGKPGDTLVAASSSNSLLTAHAVRQANGNLALLLINKDLSNTTIATVSLTGYTPSATGTVHTYGQGSAAITSTTVNGLGGSFSIAAAPYSLTTVVLSPAGSAPLPGFSLAASPASLSVAQGASGTDSVTVTPAGGFSGAVSFAIAGVPGGVTASLNPASGTGGTTLTLAAGASAAVGTSVLTLTGSSGTLSASTSVRLTVTAASSGSGALTFTPVLSNSPWYDTEQLNFASSAPITALTVSIAIAATNVSFAGMWNNVGGSIVQSHTSGTGIVYTFVLAAGATISPGSSYTFAAQANGNGTQHDPAGDTWTATYTVGGQTFTQSGVL